MCGGGAHANQRLNASNDRDKSLVKHFVRETAVEFIKSKTNDPLLSRYCLCSYQIAATDRMRFLYKQLIV